MFSTKHQHKVFIACRFTSLVPLNLNYTLKYQIVMNFKSIVFTLTAIFCFSIVSAQSFSKASSSCETTCDPSLSAVGEIPFGCNRRVFTVNSSRNHPCTIVDYVWTTTDPNASIVDAGGQAMITFSTNGTYDVCVEFIVSDGSNQCSATSCRNGVTINC